MENQTQTPEITPTEGTKNLLLMRANREYQKMLLTSITSVRVYHDNPQFKKLIDGIARTNQESLAAIMAFERYYIQHEKPSADAQETYRRVAQVYLEFALLGYRTPVEKWNDLHNHIANFRNESYAVVDDAIVDAFLSAPNDFSAGMMELVNRYFPESPDGHKKAFAIGVEKLIHVREQLGVRV